ncbi:hypothetical protein I4U23_011427 [Adineta vaga]|nr:hypothetical protein I4U23_011427 [Adineta vaga]
MWTTYMTYTNEYLATVLDEPRDFQQLYSFPNTPLLSRVDLRPFMTPVVYQHDMNTCCANAFAGIYEYIIKRTTNYHVDVSRLFINYNGQIRSQYGYKMKDLGVSQRDIALGIRDHGVVEEYRWPYSMQFLNRQPPHDAYEEAMNNTVILLRVPIDIFAIEKCLNHGTVVPIDIVLDNDTATNIQMNNGFLVEHLLDDGYIDKNAFHTVVIVGYDRPAQHFIVRNSWGENWGDRGYFYMPYNFIYNHHRVNYEDYLWTILQIIPRSKNLPSVLQLVVYRDIPREYLLEVNSDNGHDESYRRIPTNDLNNKVVAIYFSAHWCGPCQNLTPILIKHYKEIQSELHDRFDIVFLSSDENEAAFDEYFQSMPWKALPYSDRDREKKLSEKLNVDGIPTLVVLSADGKIISRDGVGDIYEQNTDAIRFWLQGGLKSPEEYEWLGISCHGCQMNPLIGQRYHCSVCENYNLCSTCQQNEHQHELTLIPQKLTTIGNLVWKGIKIDA